MLGGHGDGDHEVVMQVQWSGGAWCEEERAGRCGFLVGYLVSVGWLLLGQ
jgi:hypothetical protein